MVVGMVEALPEGVNADLLPLLQSLSNVLPAYTLNPQVLELRCHGVQVDVHGTDSFLATVASNRGRADQIVWVSLGRVRVVGDTADHHHGGALVPVHMLLVSENLIQKDMDGFVSNSL